MNFPRGKLTVSKIIPKTAIEILLIIVVKLFYKKNIYNFNKSNIVQKFYFVQCHGGMVNEKETQEKNKK